MKTKNKILYTSPHIIADLPKETPVLLAFSGGADSSALLYLLAEDAKKNGFFLGVAHFNHQIRGEEAERDAAFCEEEAKKYGLPFYLGSADVPTLAKGHKNSLENEAREQRYAFFEKIMRKNDIPILVTAHHAEDNTETVLLHILRGSGIAGLCGIAPHRSFSGDLHLVRPILKAEKCDILDLCREKGITYVTDSTNDDTNYLRNALRHDITPMLGELQPRLSDIFARLSDSAREADDLISALAAEFLNSATDESGSIVLDKFNELHASVKARVLAFSFEQLTGASLERIHIEAVCALAARGKVHSRVSLPAKYSAVIENGALCFMPDKKGKKNVNFDIPFFEGNICAAEGIIINIEKNPSENIADSSLTLDIRADLIRTDSHFRPKKEGDTIFFRKMHKKAKKLVSEKGLAPELRAKLPLLICEDEILWIPSVAVSDKVKAAKIKDGDDFFRISVKIENN